MIVIAGLASCEGPIGPAGVDGTDGVDGVDGTDGNANVQTYVYTNPAWNYVGNGLEIDMADVLTDDILENDVLLTYAKFTNYEIITSLPGMGWSGVWRNYGVYFGNSVSTDPGIFTFAMVSYEMDGAATPNANLAPVDWIKVIIIESTSTTTTAGKGIISSQQAVYNELEEAGVDVNNYYQVMDYYGLNY